MYRTLDETILPNVKLLTYFCFKNCVDGCWHGRGKRGKPGICLSPLLDLWKKQNLKKKEIHQILIPKN
jgi:hypothetical protein